MEDLISRTHLNERLNAIKEEKGKLYQTDYRNAIDEEKSIGFEPVEAVSDAKEKWVSADVMPTKPIETFVRVSQGGVKSIRIAKYRPIGFFNGGRNKWNCEAVVGVNAGCRVLEWMIPPEVEE